MTMQSSPPPAHRSFTWPASRRRSLNCAVPLVVDGAENGILALSQPSVISNLSLSGELLGDGDVQVTMQFQWIDGAMRGAGVTTLGRRRRRRLRLLPGSHFRERLRSQGSVSFASGNLLIGTSSGQPGRIENLANAVFEVGAVNVTIAAAGASLVNQGVFRKVGAGVTQFNGSGTGTLAITNALSMEAVAGSLQLDPATVAFVNSGSLSISAGAILSAGPLDGDGDVSLQAGGTLVADRLRQDTVSIAGALNLASDEFGNVSIVKQLAITGSAGTLDLNDNDLIVDYTGASPLAGVQSSINSAAKRRLVGWGVRTDELISPQRDAAEHNPRRDGSDRLHPGGRNAV